MLRILDSIFCCVANDDKRFLTEGSNTRNRTQGKGNTFSESLCVARPLGCCGGGVLCSVVLMNPWRSSEVLGLR